MHAVMSDTLVPDHAAPTAPVVTTTLYDLIAAVHETIEPGEADMVVPIVAHLLRAGHARFLRDVDREMLGHDQAPAWLASEASGVLA